MKEKILAKFDHIETLDIEKIKRELQPLSITERLDRMVQIKELAHDKIYKTKSKFTDKELSYTWGNRDNIMGEVWCRVYNITEGECLITDNGLFVGEANKDHSNHGNTLFLSGSLYDLFKEDEKNPEFTWWMIEYYAIDWFENFLKSPYTEEKMLKGEAKKIRLKNHLKEIIDYEKETTTMHGNKKFNTEVELTIGTLNRGRIILIRLQNDYYINNIPNDENVYIAKIYAKYFLFKDYLKKELKKLDEPQQDEAEPSKPKITADERALAKKKINCSMFFLEFEEQYTIIFEWYKANFNKRHKVTTSKNELLKTEISDFESLLKGEHYHIMIAIPQENKRWYGRNIYYEKQRIEKDYQRETELIKSLPKDRLVRDKTDEVIGYTKEDGQGYYILNGYSNIHEDTGLTYYEYLLKQAEDYICHNRKLGDFEKQSISNYIHDFNIKHNISGSNDFDKKNDGLTMFALEVKAWGLYLEWLKKQKNSNGKSEQNQTPQPIPTKADGLKAELQKGGFFNLEKVQRLSAKGQDELINLISESKRPYGVAMFDYLDFCTFLDNEKGTKYETNKYLSKLYNKESTDGTNIRHLRNSLTVNKKRFTSYLHIEKVTKDYELLK